MLLYYFFSTSILLHHGQLGAIIEETASLNHFNREEKLFGGLFSIENDFPKYFA